MSEAMTPFVSIVVPVLNEEHYISPCLRSLLAQGAGWGDGSSFEILVIDGGSTDRTREIVTTLQQVHPVLRLVHNPKRLQSAAMNLAARIASPRAVVLLRADGHAVYPPDFLATCVNELLTTGAESVVVPMVTDGETGFQRAVAAAQNSLIGNGGSAHRRACQSHYVEHGHHAAFRRDSFLAVGGYNEVFSHNEDAEYDRRLTLAGGHIWMCGDVTLTYFPRRDPWGLARQYFLHGAGRARTLLRHHMRPRLRQLMPLIILSGCVLGLALVPVHPIFALFPIAYCMMCLSWGAVMAMRRKDPWMLAIGLAVMIMHLSWASGFLWRCLSSVGRAPGANNRHRSTLARRFAVSGRPWPG
jgi:succinoglycan biosynthesis protein ExoA